MNDTTRIVLLVWVLDAVLFLAFGVALSTGRHEIALVFATLAGGFLGMAIGGSAIVVWRQPQPRELFVHTFRPVEEWAELDRELNEAFQRWKDDQGL